MFHLDFTAEDVRLIARQTYHAFTANPLSTMDLLLLAGTGETHEIKNVTFCDLEKLVSGMICCHGDVPAEAYPHLEKLLEGCPPECRPIP